jgi:acetyl esterase/lipase
MPNIPTGLVTWLEKIFRMDEFMSRYAGVAEDEQKFNKYVLGMRRLDQKMPPKFYRKSLQVTRNDIQGFPIYLMSGLHGKIGKVVFYLHGGAYTIGPLIPQWARMKDLVEASHCTVALLDYPKSPENQCEKTMQVCMTAFDQLSMLFGAENIILLGDSAGGGLALALSMYRKSLGMSLPARLILLSPWLDISMANPDIANYEELDLSLDIEGLRVQGTYYRGNLPGAHPLVSPIYGDINGQPVMDVYVGTHELFYPDCRDFSDKNKDKGVCLHAFDGMQHDWMMLPIAEADQVLAEIVEMVKE